MRPCYTLTDVRQQIKSAALAKAIAELARLFPLELVELPMRTLNANPNGLPPIGKICLLAAAAIHVLPLAGITGAAALMRLYGLAEIDASTELLLQHRALLFALLGGGLLAAMGYPSWRMPMVSVVLVSDVGFLMLGGVHWPLNDALQRVAIFDIASIACLFIVAICMQRAKR